MPQEEIQMTLLSKELRGDFWTRTDLLNISTGLRTAVVLSKNKRLLLLRGGIGKEEIRKVLGTRVFFTHNPENWEFEGCFHPFRFY